MNAYRKILASFAVLLLFVSLAGCSSGSESSTAENKRAPMTSMDNSLEKPMGDKAEGSAQGVDGSSSQKSIVTNRKLIKDVNIQGESTHFDKSVKSLEELVQRYNGYVQSTAIDGNPTNSEAIPRSAQYEIRIPSEKLDGFIQDLSKVGNVLSKTIKTEDVTEQYYDTDARLQSLKVQETRLLELLKKSGSLSDVLAIEKELANVRYEIESLTTTLKKYDGMVDYSVVTYYLTEVKKITDNKTPDSIWEEISKAFSNNLEFLGTALKSIFVFIVGNSPVLIISGIIGIVIWIGFKKMNRK